VSGATNEACYSFQKVDKNAPEYVPGRCNIGPRGRAIRLATGLGITAFFVGFEVLALSSVFAPFRLLLFVPFRVGLLAAQDGSVSFCVLHTSRGTCDLREPNGMAFGTPGTKVEVESQERKKLGSA
jgi:hypothetical protein